MIRTSLPTLPPQQQLLARAALESPAEVGRMTITEYAALAGTSAASVTRLCRSLGIERFSRLRTELVLAAEQRTGTGAATQVTGDITADTPLSELVSNMSVLGARSVEETARLLDPETFAHVTHALGEANQVFTTGAGSAHVVALGSRKACAASPSPRPASTTRPRRGRLAAARPGDVLIVVSETGTESEAVPQLTRRPAGVHDRADHPSVPLPAADLADHVLLAVQDRTPDAHRHPHQSAVGDVPRRLPGQRRR